ncbi:MAG: FHA domain-containing protein [Myxococcota bacterium]
MSASRTMPHAETGVLGTDAGGDLVLRRVLVRVVSGESRGAEALLEGGTLLIGSHPDNDICLSDKTVSRYHTELGLLVEGVRVRDLKSTNGTFVGSTRIESAVLSPSAEIKCGRTRIELLPADVPAPHVPSEATRFGRLVGATPAMRRLFGVLERVAAADVAVLIEGESGVGKSEVARAIHDASPRASAAFSVIDVSASLEPGDVERALLASTGGTVVLDRVDEAGARVAGELTEALGKRERGEIDVRVVATSRTDLRARVEAGAAPRDLYFHLASVRVVVPPLRERSDDLSRLIRDLTDDLGYGELQLGPEELAPLRAHAFPGNVRELQRMIEQSLVVSNRSSSLPPPPSRRISDDLAQKPFKEAKEKLVDSFERDYVARLLERHGGNLSRAAAEADLDRNYLARLAKKHGLR